MKFVKTKLPGVILIEPSVFSDVRGCFMETYHQKKFYTAGIRWDFVQDNHSVSFQGSLRGVHYQYPHSQGKLVRVVEGSVFDVAVDIRLGSPNFGMWFGTEISASNHRQLWIPPGFAHGFCVTSDKATFLYQCTDFYRQSAEHTIVWNDPTLSIQWPLKNPILSEKDSNGLTLKKINSDLLPKYNP